MRRPDFGLMVEALQAYGPEHQENKCIEECSELIGAFVKFRNGRIGHRELVSEMVDVAIMIEQMAIAHGCAEWDAEMAFKQERLARRIHDGTEK